MQILTSDHHLVEAGARRPWHEPAVIAERPLFADAQGGPGDRLGPAGPVFSPMNSSGSSTDPTFCGP